MSSFKLVAPFQPNGDQPLAIQKLSCGVLDGVKDQVLLGVTGSGKTFTMAHVIAKTNRPTLIMAPNKSLAAQLYSEFKEIFPENSVEYFVSYYDYYQPEAYIPSSDTYIQKDSSINEMIDKLRHSATRSVLARRDVIIVASVSCIFGLGAPEDYLAMRVELKNNTELVRDRLLYDLVAMQYERNDFDFSRGVFRVRGDRVEIFPAYEEQIALRIDFFGDFIESIATIDPLKGTLIEKIDHITIYPASHYVTRKSVLKRAAKTIIKELKERISYFHNANKLIEAQRIEERTNFDLEMIQELGYCTGIENYSRHLTGREQGQPPPTLLDYFPDDFLVFVDESHIAIPQIRAMYKGDRARKQTLVEYGFRLPSALDNRPLKFEEYRSRVKQIIFVSATPADYELEKARGSIIEQIVRPTGLIDPCIEVRPAKNQVDDLFDKILQRQKNNERVLVTTLTKRMAEDLTEYYKDLGIKVRYLHADITTLDRMEILRELRLGHFDVLIGINLLREGLDIPEVSLVAILDADKEGFLRSSRSLIQTCGRASRNINGKVIMYADKITRSMQYTIDETDRRRIIQQLYNKKNNIIPTTITKHVTDIFQEYYESRPVQNNCIAETVAQYETAKDLEQLITDLGKQMQQAAKLLEFEKAAKIRDIINELKKE